MFKDQESEVERYKKVAIDMEEEKNRERKERIDTIFMYESRIKGNLLALINQGNTDYTFSNVMWNPDYVIRFMTFIRDPRGRFSSKIGCWEDYIYLPNEILTYQKQIIYF